MNDPIESSCSQSPEELRQLEQTDRCNTLYVLWDQLKFRGVFDGRTLFTCRNNSNVPDVTFQLFAGQALDPLDVLVDRGDVFILVGMEEATLRRLIEAKLQIALNQL